MVSKDNYKSFLNLLEEKEIKVNPNAFEMDEVLFDTTFISNNIQETNKHLDKYETNLIKLYSLYENKLSLFYTTRSVLLMLLTRNIIFISNATIEKYLPIDRQNKLYVIDNNKFDMKNQKCEITKENKIMCYKTVTVSRAMSVFFIGSVMSYVSANCCKANICSTLGRLAISRSFSTRCSIS